MKGILGKKIGMLQVFDNHGRAIGVTLVDIRNNNALQVKTKDKDGYDSIQIGFEEKNVNKVNKPLKGHFNKAKVTAKAFIKEIRGMSGFGIGQEIKPSDIFQEGQFIDVQSYTRGQGFTGVIKRHNYSRGPMGHGSGYHRGVGSMGSITANKIRKGKLMPGRMGNELVTIQNLQIIKISEKDGYVLIKGAIPGPKNAYVAIKEAVKKPNKIMKIELSSVKDEALLKELLETAKHLGVTLTSEMSIIEMQECIEKARTEKEAANPDAKNSNTNNSDNAAKSEEAVKDKKAS